MGLPPIKLRLGGDELHLVDTRELDRWGGYLNARRAAFELTTPENIAALRSSLLIPPSADSEGVFTELRKQLEDGAALFFEILQGPVRWDAPAHTDLIDLIPKGGGDDTNGGGPTPNTGLHWIEVVCISAKGQSFAGSKAQLRLPGGRSEFVTLDSRSSIRFDDLTDSGTAHFELSGDATPVGSVQVPVGTRYEQGAPVGLVTRRRHVLIVHPNPEAFVSVELRIDGEPVTEGTYTLTTKHGEFPGALGGEPARDEGFPLPSAASYAFEGVIVPPRPAEAPVTPLGPGGLPPVAPVNPLGPGGLPPVAPVNPVGPGGLPPGVGPVGPVGPGGSQPGHLGLIIQNEEDGSPLSEVRVRVVAGEDQRQGKTDEDGRVTFADLPLQIPEVRVDILGDADPREGEAASAPPGNSSEPSTVRIPRRPGGSVEPLQLETGKIWTLQLVQPRVTVIEMEGIGFHFNSATLLPGTRTDADPDAGGGLLAIAALLRHLEHESAAKQLLIAGHTDPVGSDAFNLELSEARALNVHAFIAGDKDTWADLTHARHEPEDVQAILKWFALEYEVDTDPGPVDGDIGPATRGALTSFRRQYNTMFEGNLDPKGDPNLQDWRAVFEVYNDHLALLIDCRENELPTYRQRVTPATPEVLGCGEHWPPEQFALVDGAASGARRVDLILFHPGEVPQFIDARVGHELYGVVTFRAAYIQPDGRHLAGRYAFSI